MPNDRFNAVEGQTVRLFFRRYFNNILTDVSPLTVEIRPRGSGVAFRTFSLSANEIVKPAGTTGTYYIDWSIPSSVVDSLKYDPNFPGPGDWQDVWKTGVTTLLAQDFFVEEEGFPGSLAEIIEPIQLTHTLETPRFESGARDFLKWRVAESEGRLVPGESLFPDGEFRLWFGSQVIQNYDPMIHAPDSDEYKIFIDTTSLEPGIYNAQTRFFIPGSTIESRASITTDKSLADGFSPETDAILFTTIDGIDRNISFPSSATRAKVQSTITSDLAFTTVGNDVFIVDVNGSEKQVRLVNLPSVDLITGGNPPFIRNVDDIVNELNGIAPAPYNGGIYIGPQPFFPMVTSSIQHGNLQNPTEINGKSLTFAVDGTEFSVQFLGVATTQDVVDQINAAWTGGGDIVNATDYIQTNVTGGGLLVFADYTGGAITTIEVVGGDAISILGFTANQSDNATHSISPATASNASDAIRISAGTSLRILSAEEGSNANSEMGFPTSGNSADGDVDKPATVTGSGVIYPIQVVSEAAAFTDSIFDLADFEPSGTPGSMATSIGGSALTLNLEIDGTPLPSVIFDDNNLTTPGGITSTFAFGQYILHNLTLILTAAASGGGSDRTKTVTFDAGTGEPPMVLQDIIKQINDELLNAATGGGALGPGAETRIVADSFNGHLRIRATSTGNTVLIDNASTSFNALGFNSLTSSPENFYQNDQVQDVSGDLLADDYVNTFPLTEVVDLINAASQTALSADIASLVGNRLHLESPTTGSTSQVEVLATSDADGVLGLSVGSTFGLDGLNDDLVISVNGVDETISFTNESAKSLQKFINEINTQSSTVVASDSGGQLRIDTIATSSAVELSLFSENGTLENLGFTVVDAFRLGTITGTYTAAEQVGNLVSFPAKTADIIAGYGINLNSNTLYVENLAGGWVAGDTVWGQASGANASLLSIQKGIQPVNGIDSFDAVLDSGAFVTLTLADVTGFQVGESIDDTGSKTGVIFSIDTPNNSMKVLTADTWEVADTVDQTTGPAATSTVTARDYPSFASGGNAIFLIGVDGSSLIEVDMSSIPDIGPAGLDATDVASVINDALSAASLPAFASGVGNLLTIETTTSGANRQIEVGTINDGSSANPVLGFSIDGAIANGTAGQPYTLQQIISRINAAYGGNLVADSTSNFLRLRSVGVGAGAEVIIRSQTTANIINDWGLPVGNFSGTTTSQVSQTIVSPKLTLVIGE